MRILYGLLAFLSTTNSICLAEEPEKTPEAVVESPIPDGAKPIAIHKLIRVQQYQHLYSASPAEVKNLLENGNAVGHTYKDGGIVGYGSTKPGKGLVKLHRVRVGEFATYYVKAPDKLNPRAVVYPFPVWVWEKPGPGLVPVYGCSYKNWRNMIFSTSKESIKLAMETHYNLTKVKMTNHGIMFYVIPTKDGEAADKPDPDENSEPKSEKTEQE